MNPERFERQDVVNGLALAAILLFLGFLIMLGLFALRSSVGEVSEGVKKVTTTSTTAPEAASTAAEDVGPPKPPADVIVRVGNGANKSGLATSGTRLLAENEYSMLQGRTKEGALVDTSAVYFAEGYEADAGLIADILTIDSEQIQAMPDDPGIPIDTANVVVILGQDAEF